MVCINQRQVIVGAGALIAAPRFAFAYRTVTDSAGRAVAVPAKIERNFAAGGPASVAVYVMRPDAIVGWPRANREEEKPYLLPGVRDLPEVGMLTGRGDTVNVEMVLKMKPDLVLDFGSVRPTFVSLAEGTQQRTGIPYALIDGRFDATAASFRLLGNMMGVPERGAVLVAYTEDLFKRLDSSLAAIPEDKRPRVYADV
jgi:iron complex transport system substrate-binding protein